MANLNWEPEERYDLDEPQEETADRGGRLPSIGVILAAVIILLLLLLIVVPDDDSRKPSPNNRTAQASDDIWVYDEQTEKFYRPDEAPVEAAESVTQAKDTSLPEGAKVFRRGFGVDAGEPFIGYFEKPAGGVSEPEYEAAKKRYGDDWGKGMLIRRPNDEAWVPADSVEGRTIVAEAYGTQEKCQQGRMLYSR